MGPKSESMKLPMPTPVPFNWRIKAVFDPRLSDGMRNRPFPVVFGMHRIDEMFRRLKRVI